MATQQVLGLAETPATVVFPKFMSLDNLLESAGLDSSAAVLDDRFVKDAVEQLSDRNPFVAQYAAFIMAVHPSRSTGYLVDTLENPWQQSPASSMLVFYGPSKETIVPLVLNLQGSKNKFYHIKQVLLRYGLGQIMVGNLVSALRDPGREKAATEIFLSFGSAVREYLHLPHSRSPEYHQINSVLKGIAIMERGRDA